jgi:hypothetical protein
MDLKRIYKIGRLTKKFLFSLETGMFMLSTQFRYPSYFQPDDDIYSEMKLMECVTSIKGREKQWRWIKFLGCDQQAVFVFRDKGDYCLFLDDRLRKKMCVNLV